LISHVNKKSYKVECNDIMTTSDFEAV